MSTKDAPSAMGFLHALQTPRLDTPCSLPSHGDPVNDVEPWLGTLKRCGDLEAAEAEMDEDESCIGEVEASCAVDGRRTS